jgi:hypothetical protein
MNSGGNCKDDKRRAKELRVCLPGVLDEVFYIFRYDDAFGNRRKDAATSPSGWGKLPVELDITLEMINKLHCKVPQQ